MGIVSGITKVAKAGGSHIFNRTIGRLFGSGISADSRLVSAKAKWSGRGTKKDWRVKLTIPKDSPLGGPGGVFFNNNKLMSPLVETNGIFWPLTPASIIQHTANYNAMTQVHSNYPHQAYQNSQVDSINVIGEFPVQNQQDARHWVATVAFLRAVTKMFFGNEEDYKGNPPPILHLSGYGDHMFSKVPVVVNTFNVELRPGIDYISTEQSDVYKGLTKMQHTHFDYQNDDATWAPTLSNVSVLLTPIYSRDAVKNWSMSKFVKGELSGSKNEIGFI